MKETLLRSSNMSERESCDIRSKASGNLMCTCKGNQMTSEATVCNSRKINESPNDVANECDHEVSFSDSEWEEEGEELCNDDDDVVKFVSAPPPSPDSNRSLLCVPPPPVLGHTLSFSSDESGFYERCQSDWSDEEEDDGVCEFDEGLWHDFEKQCCFNDLFLPTTKTSIKSPTPPPPPRVDTQTSTVKKSIIEDGSISTQSRKRVTFKPDKQLVEVHCIIAWSYAYRTARKGPWEQLARDRDRFQKRINEVNDILEPCLLHKLHCKGPDN